MRTLVTLASILVFAVGAPRAAYALTGSNTMSDWLQASDTDRSHVLDDLQAKLNKPSQASRTEVTKCMNGAAQMPGHSDLQIGEVAEACSEPPSATDGQATTDL